MQMVKALPVYLDGEVELFNFAEDGIDHHSLEWFFVIQDELLDEWSENDKNGCGNTGFIHNQSNILEAFVKGNLYGLCMPETNLMYDNVTPDDPHFMNARRGAQYRFPVFCAVINNRIDMLWVAVRMRRRGLGTRLVECLKERGVSGADYVEGALPFWQRLGTVTHSTSHAQVAFG
jgi:GNAT superfamily N-acetyltransferase